MTKKRLSTPTRTEQPAATRRANKAPIRRISSGVPGLDAVLGGGYPELSFNVIAGAPGSGKTTLALHTVFANATPERPGLLFTVLGEPTLKMIRYQQQFDFFDPARIGRDVHLLNLSAEAITGSLDAVLERIMADVTRLNAGVVVVDSFRSIGRQEAEHDSAPAASLAQFVQELGVRLTSWETTSFLISEYAEDEQRHPVFTVADGILRLSQVIDRNSVVRKLQVLKVRGQGFMPGLHTLRITGAGVQVCPRIPEQQQNRHPAEPRRLSIGVPELDKMLGGGIPAGDAVMLAGPTGSGKTSLATQFVAEGVRSGDAVVVAVFEEYPERYLTHAKARGIDLEAMIAADQLRVIYLRPLDLSVDETLAEILEAVRSIDAARVVIDSVSGFEIALAPTFREDFRESFYRLIGALTAVGATVLMTNEVPGSGPPGDMAFTGERVSFLTDDIIIQRHVEIDGALQTVLAVVKMRGGAHSHEFREFSVTPHGVVIGQPLGHYNDILTGFPKLHSIASRAASTAGVPSGRVGLTEQESAVLDALMQVNEASPAELTKPTALAKKVVATALTRLVALDYAVAVDQVARGSRFRALAPGRGLVKGSGGR